MGLGGGDIGRDEETWHWDLILIPHPHPKDNPLQRCPSSVPFPERCSDAQQDSFPFSSGVLDFCKCLGPQERCQESWTFHSFDYCVATPTNQCSSNFFSAMSTWPDAKRLRCGLGAELWRLSTAPLIAGFPASAALPSLGAVHCLQLREFSFCYFLHYCLSSICPVHSFLEFQMGAYGASRTHPVFLLSCLIIFIFSSLSSEFGGNCSHWSSKWLIWILAVSKPLFGLHYILIFWWSYLLFLLKVLSDFRAILFIDAIFVLFRLALFLFYSGTVLDLQSRCRDITERSHRPFTQISPVLTSCDVFLDLIASI